MDHIFFLNSRSASKNLTHTRVLNPNFLGLELIMEPPMPETSRTGSRSGTGSSGFRSPKHGHERRPPSPTMALVPFWTLNWREGSDSTMLITKLSEFYNQTNTHARRLTFSTPLLLQKLYMVIITILQYNTNFVIVTVSFFSCDFALSLSGFSNWHWNCGRF